ncbi:hypothetical protein [Amycolatopsis minnesotensis]
MLRRRRPWRRLAKGTIEAIPLPAETTDVVISLRETGTRHRIAPF